MQLHIWWSLMLSHALPHGRVCTELKEDIKGQKEFKEYLTTLELQRADLQGRIDKNKAWVVS